MREEELRKIAKEEMLKLIMDNLDSSLIFTYITNLEKENKNAKWYVHQVISRITEDIADYVDDDKEANKNLIGELRETRKQWQDIEKLLNGESKDKLYIDWRKYGEYE